jgi:hypothetical protein
MEIGPTRCCPMQRDSGACAPFRMVSPSVVATPVSRRPRGWPEPTFPRFPEIHMRRFAILAAVAAAAVFSTLGQPPSTAPRAPVVVTIPMPSGSSLALGAVSCGAAGRTVSLTTPPTPAGPSPSCHHRSRY